MTSIASTDRPIRLPFLARYNASGAQVGASLTGYVLTYSALLLSYMVVITHLSGKGAQ